MTDITTTDEPRAMQAPDNSPAAMLAEAVRQGMTPEALEKLADLQIKMRAEDARQAFASAYADAQADLEPVRKDADGHNSRYASLSAVERAVRPVLAKHDLSYYWTTDLTDGRVAAVVCVLEHRGGHDRRVPFPCAIDESARGQNASQKVASAVSYARRYSLLLAVGISTSDTGFDDDAESLHETITDQQAADLEALCEEVGADRVRFLKWLAVESFEALPAAKHDQAVKGLEAKRAKA